MKNKKRLLLTFTSALLSASIPMSAAAAVQIGAAPDSMLSPVVDAIGVESILLTETPQTAQLFAQVVVDNENDAYGPGPGTTGSFGMTGSAPQGNAGNAGGSGSAQNSDGTGVAGSRYQNAEKTEVALPVTLVSPNHWNGNYYDAEASVQLADGSWSYFTVRAPYYRVLREETDSTGVQWYICAVYASEISGWGTPDGSFAQELWLKKSDCKATSSISLNTTNPTRIQIVQTAISLLGKQYTAAGSGPDAFDCSGFVNYVYAQAGIGIPRTSTAICNLSQQISMEELRPGDIAGRPGHVAVYIGDGWFVHSSETSTGVVSEYVTNYNGIHPFTNYINAFGD